MNAPAGASVRSVHGVIARAEGTWQFGVSLNLLGNRAIKREQRCLAAVTRISVAPWDRGGEVEKKISPLVSVAANDEAW